MSNSIENPSFERKPENPERKEKFEDFGIEIGDRIYSQQGDYRQVYDLIQSESHYGGGCLLLERVDKEKDEKPQIVSFGNLLEKQDYIERIEKPPLLKDETNISARYKAALKQVARQLEAPINEKEKSALLRKRAAILWEIAEKKSKGI